MARSGVYAWDVKRARDALIARGRHPSIDAVRAELGNTGSKTTIHKYLRELETEESTAAVSVGNAIQTLVVQLAEQLKAEAEITMEAVRTELSVERVQHEQQVAVLNATLADTCREHQAVSQQLELAQQHLADVQQQLQQEQLARYTEDCVISSCQNVWRSRNGTKRHWRTSTNMREKRLSISAQRRRSNANRKPDATNTKCMLSRQSYGKPRKRRH